MYPSTALSELKREACESEERGTRRGAGEKKRRSRGRHSSAAVVLGVYAFMPSRGAHLQRLVQARMMCSLKASGHSSHGFQWRVYDPIISKPKSYRVNDDVYIRPKSVKELGSKCPRALLCVSRKDF